MIWSGGSGREYQDRIPRWVQPDPKFETVRLGVRLTQCAKKVYAAFTMYDLQLEVIRPPSGTQYDDDLRFQRGRLIGGNGTCFATNCLGMEPNVGDELEVDLVRRRSDDLYIIQNPKRLEPQKPEPPA